MSASAKRLAPLPLAGSGAGGGAGLRLGCSALLTVRPTAAGTLPSGNPGDALPASTASASNAATAAPAWPATARRGFGGGLTGSPSGRAWPPRRPRGVRAWSPAGSGGHRPAAVGAAHRDPGGGPAAALLGQDQHAQAAGPEALAAERADPGGRNAEPPGVPARRRRRSSGPSGRRRRRDRAGRGPRVGRGAVRVLVEHAHHG